MRLKAKIMVERLGKNIVKIDYVQRVGCGGKRELIFWKLDCQECRKKTKKQTRCFVAFLVVDTNEYLNDICVKVYDKFFFFL